MCDGHIRRGLDSSCTTGRISVWGGITLKRGKVRDDEGTATILLLVHPVSYSQVSQDLPHHYRTHEG